MLPKFLRPLHPHRLLLRSRLRHLRGTCQGKRCFIMGNGPSLNLMDLNRLEGEDVWGLNKCHLLFDRISWRPRHMVGIDRVVIPDMRETLIGLMQSLPKTNFYFPAIFYDKGVLPAGRNVFYFKDREPGVNGTPAFSSDAADCLAKTRTVTLAALQLAVYLGYDPIYLIGCDTSYSVGATVKHEGEGTLLSTRDDDENHFSPGYFGAGARWRDPRPEAMLENYAEAAARCRALGVQVFNATAGGKLESFPRVVYNGLFHDPASGV